MLAGDRVLGVVVLLAVECRAVRRADDRARDDVRRPGLDRDPGVQLVQELEQRSRQLAQSVHELSALGEVSQAVSSSLDLDEVLDDDRHTSG